MRLIRLVPLLALLLAAPAAHAQDRIAYVDVELILSLMPATAAANDSLGRYQEQLAAKLRTKEQYAQQKLEEAQAAVATGATEAQLDGFRTELSRLEGEIRQQAADSDRKMASKRDALMAPIINRLGDVLQEIAELQSYDFILNGVDGSGTSIVLFGREDRDVTKLVLEKMGIAVPKGGDESE
ncbi:OmpH family outer membrane protein [bacterium]|nr:OmpH family outer membrane protein [bacterium]